MKNFRDSTFPCSAEPSFLGSLHGQERNAICEANRESETMHPLSERDRAKKDYGKVDLEIFENACRYFLENISEFKDLLSEKVPTLKKRIGYIVREEPKPAKQMKPVRKRSAKLDWNIPQIYILGFISARYKNSDF